MDAIANAHYGHSLWGHGVAKSGWDYWCYQRASSEDALDNDVSEEHGERRETEEDLKLNDEPPGPAVNVPEEQRNKQMRRKGVQQDFGTRENEPSYGMPGSAKKFSAENPEGFAKNLVRAYLCHPKRSARHDAEVEAIIKCSGPSKRLWVLPSIVIPAHPSPEEIRAQKCYAPLEDGENKPTPLAEDARLTHLRYLKWKTSGTLQEEKTETRIRDTTDGDSDHAAYLRYVKWKLGK